MNDDKFQLWRLALSCIHIDGKVTEQERVWFDQKISDLKKNSILSFSSEQINELKQSLSKPLNDFEKEFDKISKPSDRAFLLHTLRVISHLDKDFSSEERALYTQLEQKVLKGVDVEAVEKITAEMEEQSYHEDEVYSIDNKSSRLEAALMKSLRVLNRGTHKYPKGDS